MPQASRSAAISGASGVDGVNTRQDVMEGHLVSTPRRALAWHLQKACAGCDAAPGGSLRTAASCSRRRRAGDVPRPSAPDAEADDTDPDAHVQPEDLRTRGPLADAVRLVSLLRLL